MKRSTRLVCRKTGGEEKKNAIEYATETIADLEAFLGDAAGREGELKTEIGVLETDIAADNSAIAQASGVRDKENGEFASSEADLKESIGLIKEALSTITEEKSFVQTGKVTPEVATALVQVSNIAKKHVNNFEGVMQKDLFDMLGSFNQMLGKKSQSSTVATGAFLGEVFLPKKDAALLAEGPASGGGAAAGAKSYNSQSGQVVGLLEAMQDEMIRDLSAEQKEEFKALVDFQNLRAAKLAEIEATNKQKELTETALADLLNKAAQAHEDLEATKEAKAADETFLAELEKNCQVVDQEYQDRSKIRADEVVALSETIEILTGDDARELFAKSVGTSFLQVDMSAEAQDKRVEKVMQKLMKAGKKHNNLALMSLAVNVRLDAFTKVKATMTKMLAELKTQQSNEVEQFDLCKKNIDETEDAIKVENNNKDDLEESNTDQTNTLATLADEIKTLKQEVADQEVQLKKGGLDRKAENELYQQAVADQRATVTILNMALDRMKKFYAASAASALVQIKAHNEVPPPPPKPGGFEKSAGAGGVLQLLAQIISEAEQEAKVLELTENQAQKGYGKFVASSTISIEADRNSIAEKEKHTAETSGALSKTEEGQLANEQMLESLLGQETALHAECDYVIKYFKLRQGARAEEMDSIEEAMAILSGADFGL